MDGLDTVASCELALRAGGVLVVPHHGGPWASSCLDLGRSASRAASAASSTTGALAAPFALAMGPAGFVAVIAGWVTTEVGRQPFTVYGLLRTATSASPLEAPAVAASLRVFIVIYFIVFGAGAGYILQADGHAPHRARPGPSTGSSDPHRRHHAGPGGRSGAAPSARRSDA